MKQHRMEHTRVYNIWEKMKQRCLNPNHEAYHRYGGRGIQVCESWMDFRNFYRDMGDPPPGHQLDREDNDGNYCPGNCRWVTASQNSKNRASTVWIEDRDGPLCLTDWSERYSLNKSSVSRWLKAGLTPQQILTEKVNT